MSVRFDNCRIIDGNGREIPRGFVTVKDKRIEAVGAGQAPLGSCADEVIDLGGRSLLPGIIDCHVHLCLNGSPDPSADLLQGNLCVLALQSYRNAYRTLQSGVTTVRDLGSSGDAGIHLRNAINSGLVSGLRVYSSGKLICMTGGHGWNMGREADGEADVRKAVREQMKAGADVIKLMATGGVMTPGVEAGAPQLTFDELKAGVEEAHKGGRKVASHVMGTQGLINALSAGIDSIEHGVALDDEIIGMFLERKAFLVPTLSAPYFILQNGPEQGIPAYVMEKTHKVADIHYESARKAYRAGVTIAMGTDAGTPFNLHGANMKELELLCSIGMSPMEAIISATSIAARLLGVEQGIGTIDEGKLADLIVVDGNPIEDITLLQRQDRILAVMKDGIFYKKTIGPASR